MDKASAKRQARNDVHLSCKHQGRLSAMTSVSQTYSACNLVFSIELLRETIIKYVLEDIKGGFSAQNALSCRMVQKSWLDSVFKCLVKSGKTLVKFELSGYSGRTLQPFQNILENTSGLPIKALVTFYPRNFELGLKTLVECLRLCGDGLVELELRFFLDHEFLHEIENSIYDFSRQSFTLPVLHKISYSFPELLKFPNINDTNGDMWIRTIPQHILSNCSRLKCLGIIGGRPSSEALPASLGNLVVPTTITNLALDFQKNTYYLERLIKNNSFSKLTGLTVIMPVRTYGENEVITALLSRVCDNLQSLNFRGENFYLITGSDVTKVDIPLMKCLKTISIHTRNFEWVDGVVELQRKLPALRKIDLKYVTSSSLIKWTSNSKFASLNDVSVKFDDRRSFENIEFFTLEHAQLMSEAFPNIAKLEIYTLCLPNVNQAVQCLFKNMPQLQVFTIKLEEIPIYQVHKQYLDSLLLGIPFELIESMKTECVRGTLWEAVQLRLDKQFSVCNLSELQEFSLEFIKFDDPTFVSDKVKEYVVSSMPKLQKINVPHLSMVLALYSKANIRYWKETERIFNWVCGSRQRKLNTLGGK